MTRDRMTRMDISTAIDRDPKFRRLAHNHPELYTGAFTAYMGILAASWEDGTRLTAGEGWPLLLSMTITKSGITTRAVLDALQEVELLDQEERVNEKAWEDWYVKAAERTRNARARYSRYNEKRALRDSSPKPSLQASQPAISNHVVTPDAELDRIADGIPSTTLQLPRGSDAVGAIS